MEKPVKDPRVQMASTIISGICGILIAGILYHAHHPLWAILMLLLAAS